MRQPAKATATRQPKRSWKPKCLLECQEESREPIYPGTPDGSGLQASRYKGGEKGDVGLKTVGVIEGLYLELCWLASISAAPTPTQITGSLALILGRKAR